GRRAAHRDRDRHRHRLRGAGRGRLAVPRAAAARPAARLLEGHRTADAGRRRGGGPGGRGRRGSRAVAASAPASPGAAGRRAAADKFFVRHGKVLLLTWGGSPDTKAIIAGRDDAMIRARAAAVKRLGGPILMEFRHEMDRPNLQWTIHGPASYIKAWDHVRAI